ncbi:MAG: hypothetical protein JSU77_05190 [Fidelibacterota bacterium]|nr:MAG: hypothetical protein JSU77_05190 [Candidatus Neomarinimicrobiota bacterium]
MPHRSILTSLITGFVLTVAGLQARELPVKLDLGLFRTESNRTRLEVYLGLDRRGITYKREGNRYAAHLAGVVLIKQRGQIIQFQEMVIDDVVDHLDNGAQGIIPKQVTFSLNPGSYELQVTVGDRHGNQSDSTLQVEVPGYRDSGLEISTIQLSNLIRRSDGLKEFFKRGLTVWPNAGCIYSSDRPLLWHYTEVYGLTPLDTVTIRTGIWRDNTEVISLGPRRTLSPSLVFSDWGAVDLSSLAAGDYRFSLAIAVDGDSISVMKPFRVVREVPVPGDSGDILVGLSPAELTDFARGLRMLPTGLNLQRFRSIDSTGRLQIVRDAAREIAHGLVQDSSLQTGELLRRWGLVKAYDRDWRSRRQLTEQGRTMFLYGTPAAVETYPATSTLREHQIWTYIYADSIGPSGQASRTDQFVFVDREGYGEFALVHATAPGAVQNDNWRRELSWVPVRVDEQVTPAAEEVIEEVAPAVVLDTVLAEPALLDTLTTPGPQALPDTLTMDTLAVMPVPSDTTAADTTAVDSLLIEPATGDTTTTP